MAREENEVHRDRLHDELTKIVGTHMPKELFENALAEALQQAIARFKLDEYSVRQYMAKQIEIRATELLNTTYKEELDKMASQVIMAGIAARR